MALVIRRILVPVDFSEGSRRALNAAWEWARAFDAKIDLLHVWSIPSFIPPGLTVKGDGSAERSLLEQIRSRTEQEMQRFSSEAEGNGIRIRATRSEPGLAARTIVEHAERGDYDLIVMGTHGRRGLEHVLLGSVTERVLRRSKRPVLTVRTHPHTPDHTANAGARGRV